jgi:hypothetical protein
VYRLHLTNGPFVRHTAPLAAQRGQKGTLRLVGWNLAAAECEFDAAHCSASVASTELPIPGTPLALSEVPELLEHEPNDLLAAAQSLAIPSAVTAHIGQAKDEDRYTFTVQKQRIYELKITGDPCGSPLDAWLAIEGPDGKEVAREDDTGKSTDPQLTWTAPSDGTFTAVVGDLTHRGGPEFVYRLALKEAVSSFDATASAHALTIAPGKTAELKVTIQRTHGFAAKLQLNAQNLPEGVAAEPVEISEKANDGTLKLTAAAEAKPANRPFSVVVQQAGSAHRQPVRFPLKGTDENFPEAIIDSTEQLWITVTADPPK